MSHTSSYRSVQSGFTLIELMISLVLGLLISAAVMQVYFINTRTLTVQQSASEVQDSTIFAMQTLEEHVRLANLGNATTNINNLTKNGGIVLSTSNIGNTNYANTGYLTVSAGQTGTGTNGWTGISNMDKASDQLTIQYKNITPNPLYDCEGAEITAGSSSWVIERYFVRATNSSQTTITKDLALACDAGRVTDAGVVSDDFGDNGEIIIPTVDQFKVLLGAMTDINKMTYMPAKTYLTLTDKPDITTIKLGVVIRSSTPLLSSTDKGSFMLLDETNTLKTDSSRKKFYRRAYESTVLLRNARVMSVIAVATAP